MIYRSACASAILALGIAVAAGASVTRRTVAALPSSPPTGATMMVVDGADASDCTTGGGAALVLCTWDGAAWVPTIATSGGGSSRISDDGDDVVVETPNAGVLAIEHETGDQTTVSNDGTHGYLLAPSSNEIKIGHKGGFGNVLRVGQAGGLSGSIQILDDVNHSQGNYKLEGSDGSLLLDGRLEIPSVGGSRPATPPAGHVTVYWDADTTELCVGDSGGTWRTTTGATPCGD